MSKVSEKIKASTQEHLDIDDITQDLVLLKTGWVAMVLATSAVNFDILSEAEQDATMYAYGALLNSLTFPLQTLIRSKKQDISAYFQHLVEAEKNQQNPDLKRQMQKYRDFIQSTVQQRTLLDKKFYLIIHFSPLELGVGNVKKQNLQSNKSKLQLIADARATMAPKRDHLIKQTARLGLISKQLTTQELIELFYDIYNPASVGTQRVLLDSASYTVPLVEPDVETPSPSPTPVETELAHGASVGGQKTVQVQMPPQIPTAIPGTDLGQATPVVSSGPVVVPVLPQSEQVPSQNQEEALKSLQEATQRAVAMAQKG